MTGAPIDAKNTEVSVVDAEEDSDEYITSGSKAIKIKKLAMI